MKDFEELLDKEMEQRENNLYGDGGIESNPRELKRFLEASDKLLDMNPLIATLRLSEQFSIRRLKVYVLLINNNKISLNKKNQPFWNQVR